MSSSTCAGSDAYNRIRTSVKPRLVHAAVLILRQCRCNYNIINERLRQCGRNIFLISSNRLPLGAYRIEKAQSAADYGGKS